jgi:hypothetical protein
MTNKKHKMRVIGRREFVSLSLLGVNNIEAKIDTGAYTCSLHCENIGISNEGSKPVLFFTVEEQVNGSIELKSLRFEAFSQKTIKNSFGEMEERYVIKTLLHIGKKKIWSEISLSNRDAMRYPLLIGRKLLKGKFLVDVDQIHTGGLSLDHAFKQLSEKN